MWCRSDDNASFYRVEGAMMEGFLPCPFCGVEVDWCSCDECHQVYCPHCNTLTDIGFLNEPYTLEMYREMVVKAWNTRHYHDNKRVESREE